MRGIWNGIKTHRLAALLFALLWITAWFVTIATWERNPAGYSVGMSSIATPFHFVLPLVAGGLAGALRSKGSSTPWKACALAGLIFGVVHFAVLQLVDVLWLPEAEFGLGSTEWAAEALAFALTYAVICVVLSVIGGGTGRAISAVRND